MAYVILNRNCRLCLPPNPSGRARPIAAPEHALEPSLIQPADIQQALRALRRSGAVPQSPLLGLAVVGQRLAELGLEPSRDNREWALAALLAEIVATRLHIARGGPPAQGSVSDALPAREDAARLLAADFGAGDIEREAWSVLYYRFIAPHPLRVQRLAALTQPGVRYGTRQIARRIERGNALLAEAVQEREAQARFEAAAPDPARMNRGSPVSNNLPLRLSRFIGRSDAMRRLKADIAKHRIVTLVGFGGIGKTRLAIQTAAEVVDAFEDGVWFVDLSVLADPRLVPGAVAHVLNIAAPADPDVGRTLASELRSQHLLLVIDNGEHVIDACAELVRQLAAECPGVHVLTTSREALAIEGEILRPVQPLAVVPQDTAVTAEAVQASEAAQLLVDRIQTVDPDFVLTDRNAPLAAELVRRLEGIPLAIELAAAWAFALPLGTIAVQIQDPLASLTRGARSAPDRQQTLRGAIEWSFNLLDPAERALFANLAVLQGGWDLEAVQGICVPDGSSDHDVIATHAGLVAKSLVVADMAGHLPRYRFYEPVRLFAAETLAGQGRTVEMQRCHAGHFVAFAERAKSAFQGSDQAEWLARFDLDHNNLRAALRWCLDTRATDWAQRIALAIWGFWHDRGLYAEGRAWLAEILDQTERDVPTLVEARLLKAFGTLAIYQADYGATRSLLEESVRLSLELGDEGLAMSCMVHLAHVSLLRGDLPEARRIYESYLAMARRQGEVRAEPVILGSLAGVMTLQGDGEPAQALLWEALRVAQSLGDDLNAADALSHLGAMEISASDNRTANQWLNLALADQVRLGDSVGIEQTLRDLGLAAYLDGRLDRAEELLQRSLALSIEHGNPWSIGETQMGLGRCAFERGDVAAARSLLGESLANALRFDHPVAAATARHAMGEASLRGGQLAAARDYLLDALESQVRIGIWPDVATTLGTLAVLARRKRRHDIALRLAASVANRTTFPRSPWYRPALDKAVATARAALDPDVADRIWAEGAAMSLEEAAAWARDVMRAARGRQDASS